MPNENAIVSAVVRIEPPLERPPAELLRAEPGISVELEGELRVRLDPDDARSPGFAQVLDGLRQQHLPVYLELDPRTSRIVRLLIPHVARVAAVRPSEGDALAVDLVPSQAGHLLKPETPDRDELERRLREAERVRSTLVVTETDAHEIIDVRDYTPDPERRPFPFPKRPVPPQPFAPQARPLWWRWSPRDLVLALLVSTVVELLLQLHLAEARAPRDPRHDGRATTCPPLTVPAPCIPFLYPDDGCWARASEMCRLMINSGAKPRKVWIQGSLHVSTRNNPNCFVDWGWHVAPTLCVRGSFVFFVQRMVIDPSLFSTPSPRPPGKAFKATRPPL